MKRIRNSNIELLRIFSILGVIILHYNNASMGKAFVYTSQLPLNHGILYFFECLCICSVNVFVLLTGYFMCKSKDRSIHKPLKLVIEVIFFSLFFYFMKVFFGMVKFSTTDFLYKCLPANYFVILYITLYFISPYINILLENLDKKSFNKLMITLLVIFSIYPSLLELFNEVTSTSLLGLSTIGMYGSQYGYTIVNFVLMYIIGAYIRLNDIKLYCKMKNIALYLMCAIILLLWCYLGMIIGKDTTGSALSYFNPFCILESVSLFMLFKQFRINNMKLINHISKGTFIVFLIHTNFMSLVHIESFVTKSPIVMTIHLIISTCFIYAISLIVYIIYSFAFERVIDLLIKKRRRLI